MDDIIEVVDINEVSPYEANYPLLLLADGIKKKVNQAQEVAQVVYRTVAKESPVLAETAKTMKKGSRYVVDMSEDLIKAIDQGKVKLSQTKDGKLCAQLLQENGKFGPKLGIKKEAFRGSVDPTQVANALQMAALQEQIQCLTDQIISIDHSVRDVLQGQQNDRIGLYYSGLALYLEAQNTENEGLKQALLIQALRSLSESTFQLGLTMQSDIKYLVDKEYSSEKGKKVKLIDEKMTGINKAFDFIHQASLLRAAIYCQQGEMKAMTTVLSEYSRFIETTVAKNAGLLAQCDVSDQGGMSGVWQTRAQLTLDVSDLQKQLNSEEKVFYLGMEG